MRRNTIQKEGCLKTFMGSELDDNGEIFPHLNQPQPSYDLASALTDTCGVKKGIDLENRSDEVRKLFYAGFGARCSEWLQPRRCSPRDIQRIDCKEQRYLSF